MVITVQVHTITHYYTTSTTMLAASDLIHCRSPSVPGVIQWAHPSSWWCFNCDLRRQLASPDFNALCVIMYKAYFFPNFSRQVSDFIRTPDVLSDDNNKPKIWWKILNISNSTTVTNIIRRQKKRLSLIDYFSENLGDFNAKKIRISFHELLFIRQ